MHFIILSFPPFSAENIVKAVKWLKDGHAVTNMDPKYQKFDSKLRINNVQTENGGVYQCFVTLDSGKQIQSSGELRLGGKAHYVHIKDKSPEVPFHRITLSYSYFEEFEFWLDV